MVGPRGGSLATRRLHQMEASLPYPHHADAALLRRSATH